MGQHQSNGRKIKGRSASPSRRDFTPTAPNAALPRRVSKSGESERRTVTTADQSIDGAAAAGTPGYMHHLFLIGSGLSLPVGQEPYASFNLTKVKAALQKQEQAAHAPPAPGLQPQQAGAITAINQVSPPGAGMQEIPHQTRACLDFFKSMGGFPTPMAARPAGTPPPAARYRAHRQGNNTAALQQGAGRMAMSPVLKSSGTVEPAAGAPPAGQASSTTGAAPGRAPSTAATMEDTQATAPHAPAPAAPHSPSPSGRQAGPAATSPGPSPPLPLRPGSAAAAVNDAMAAAVERHPWCTATVIVSAFEPMRIGRSWSNVSHGTQSQPQGQGQHSQELRAQQQHQPAGVRGASPQRDSARKSAGSAVAGTGLFDLQPQQVSAAPLTGTSAGAGGDSVDGGSQQVDSDVLSSQNNNAYLVDETYAAPGVTDLAAESAGSLAGGSLQIIGTSSTGWPVTTANVLPPEVVLRELRELREVDPSLFLILWHPAACEDAALRAAAFAAGANMVTFSERDLSVALTRVVGQAGTGDVTCEYCGLEHLTPADYWMHLPLYHTYERNLSGTCQVCGSSSRNLAVHVHEMHGPAGPKPEVRTGVGAVVVVHRPSDNKFLMVQEFAGQGFWTPGGGTDAGERLSVSAVREVIEEAGVEVEIQGVLELEYDPDWKPLPWRFVVMYGVARPGPSGAPQVPKTVPDFESAGACWVPASLLPHLPLRNPWVPNKWYPLVSEGQFEVLPLEIPEEFKEGFKGLVM